MDYSKKKTAEKHLEELTVNLGELVGADPPLPEADLIAAAKAKKLEWQLPGEEVVKARAPDPDQTLSLSRRFWPANARSERVWAPTRGGTRQELSARAAA